MFASIAGLHGLKRSGAMGGPSLMPLNKNLVVLTSNRLIACRECGATADVSINNAQVKLICPGCHKTLGTWPTTSEAVADMEAFVAKRAQGNKNPGAP